MPLGGGMGISPEIVAEVLRNVSADRQLCTGTGLVLISCGTRIRSATYRPGVVSCERASIQWRRFEASR